MVWGGGALQVANPREPRTCAWSTPATAPAHALVRARHTRRLHGPRAVRPARADRRRRVDATSDRYRDLIDLYLTLHARRSDTATRWTYNGAPPHAGSVVLDAVSPDADGWIAWRWHIPTWYVWDALYWHDRHNRHGTALPGKPLVPTVDPVSFNDR